MNEVRPKRQPLTLEQMHDGFMKALAQAERLADEARVLAKKKLFSGALSKAILGMEEIGKNRLLLYQAGTDVMGQPKSWDQFWRSYRSHIEKLEFAIQWATVLNPDLTTGEEVRAHLKLIAEKACQLDKQKQQSQYVGFDGKNFSRPNDDDLREDAKIIIEFLDSLCLRLREEYPPNFSNEEFLEVMSEKVRLSRALGFIDPLADGTPDMLAEAIADGNSPVMINDGMLPSIDEFKRRVEERYKILPQRIQITLKRLNDSIEFEQFYYHIGDRYGYPDWVIISTIFNIALNARLFPAGKMDHKDYSGLLDWQELANDDPLPVELFTDETSFNSALDLWLTAFLTGLGIKVPDLSSNNIQKIRRVASRFYSVFEWDIEHWPIFHFCGLCNEYKR